MRTAFVLALGIPIVLLSIAWDWARDGFPVRLGPSIDPARAPDAYGTHYRGQMECDAKARGKVA